MSVQFSQEVADKVCDYLASGKSLISLRRVKIEGMPSVSGIMKWLAEGAALRAEGKLNEPKALFVEQYARATAIRADVLFEECLEIADDTEFDSIIDDDGKQIHNTDHIQRAKLRVDTRKWMVGKLKPDVYGDKVLNTHEGNPDKPVTFTLKIDNK